MATELVIHCVGLEGLTITVSGADHSIPIITDVLRVTTLLGSVEYTIPQLPVTYNTADLNGNLTISDESGKTLYRWRSHAIAQPPSAEQQQPRSEPTYNHERQKHPPCISAPPSYRTAGTPPNLRSSGALNELNNSQIASSDADAMAENPDGPRRLRSGHGRKVTYLESSLSRSNSTKDHSPWSSPVQRLERTSKRKSNRVFQFSEDSDAEPSGSDIPLGRKRRPRLTPKVATTDDSGSDPLESDTAPPRKRRSERIKLQDSNDRESDISLSDITRTRKIFLRRLIDRLLRESDEDSEPFAEPVDTVAEEVPTYYAVIKRPMDLRTLRENLGKGIYSTVESFEAAFYLIIENSILFNGLGHKVSQGGLRLLKAFRVLIASLP